MKYLLKNLSVLAIATVITISVGFGLKYTTGFTYALILSFGIVAAVSAGRILEHFWKNK